LSQFEKERKKTGKRVDKGSEDWYYREAPYGKGAAERKVERPGKPHGTLKIKQRVRKRNP
jgi:hypothetical protein